MCKSYYSAYTHSNMGIRLAEEGETYLAIKYFLDSVKLNPYHVPGYIGLGNELLSIGKVDDALKNFENALKIDPGNVIAKNDLKKALDIKMRSAEPKKEIRP